MGADATVVSLSEIVGWQQPLAPQQLEQRLTRFLDRLGGTLQYKGIIPGHIKMVAACDGDPERFLFLSMTTIDRVDRKPSAAWSAESASALASVRLDINVLVFGHEKSFVTERVSMGIRQDVLQKEGAAPVNG
ncbi:MAG TPA: hypothetical protein VN611_00465 [Patescibacteria group bacterium]|nr:hypothetical protein [Patescibacteria group bacterium]